MTKILIDRATVEQALEALELYVPKEDYENKPVGNVIDALRAALAEPDIDPVDEYRKGFIDGQIDMRSALAEPVQEPAPMPPFPPVSLWKRGCAVCGIGAGGHAYGYACPRSDCPTRVTCGGTV